MGNYSIVECNSCGDIKLLSNYTPLGEGQSSCGCGNPNVSIYSLINDKKFQLRKIKS